MNLPDRLAGAPAWMAFGAVAALSCAVWALLTLLERGALAGVDAEIRPLVSGLAALGNVLSATAVLAFWPLVTLAFWCCGLLVAGPVIPDYPDLLRPVGAAHLPAAAATLAAWALLLGADVWIAPGTPPGEISAMPVIRVCRALIAAGYLLTAGCFVAAVRRAFRFAWPKAAAVAAAPFLLYYLLAMLA